MPGAIIDAVADVDVDVDVVAAVVVSDVHGDDDDCVVLRKIRTSFFVLWSNFTEKRK